MSIKEHIRYERYNNGVVLRGKTSEEIVPLVPFRGKLEFKGYEDGQPLFMVREGDDVFVVVESELHIEHNYGSHLVWGEVLPEDENTVTASNVSLVALNPKGVSMVRVSVIDNVYDYVDYLFINGELVATIPDNKVWGNYSYPTPTSCTPSLEFHEDGSSHITWEAVK